MTDKLTLETVQAAVCGDAAAFRYRGTLQPAGGPGDKVFPPTYQDGHYATEKRRVPDREEPVECVVLDSVQSQANRMEEALQKAVDAERIQLPVIKVDFSEADLLDPVGRVTSLQAPHRVSDAILRDSEREGTPFRQTDIGKAVDRASITNATPLYRICPTALVFGMWDSTGPKGGLGAKFQRTIVSEIVGIDVAYGTKSSSRIDPLGIKRNAGPIYETPEGGWTLDPENATQQKGKPKLLKKEGKPSKANHGNVKPTLSERERETRQPIAGGVTMSHAEQTTVLSLPALRRLAFPLPDGTHTREADRAGQTVLAALGLAATSLAVEKGLDLRSRCLLWPQETPEWELLERPTESPRRFAMDSATALSVLNDAVAAAKAVGLDWLQDGIELKPSQHLVELVHNSQQLAVTQVDDEGAE